jgi:hypothetical protein
MLIGDVALTFDAGAVDVTTFDITLARPVDEPFLIGDAALGREPRDGKLAATGSVTMLFETNTQYTKFLNDTNVDIQLVVTNGVESLTLNFNKCRLTAHSKPITAENSRVLSEIEWTSFFDTTATENAQAVLVNDDATIP